MRPGVNPQYGDFDVLTVDLEDGSKRMFAAGLANHILNEEPATDTEEDNFDPKVIQSTFGNCD